jgi:hypothetical protein
MGCVLTIQGLLAPFLLLSPALGSCATLSSHCGMSTQARCAAQRSNQVEIRLKEAHGSLKARAMLSFSGCIRYSKNVRSEVWM